MLDYIAKLRECLRGRVLVAIDGANIEQSVRRLYVHPRDIPDALHGQMPDELSWAVDYRSMYHFFSSGIDLAEMLFYTARFETTEHDGFLTVLKRIGYTLRTKVLKEYADHQPDHPHRKANFDVELALDVRDRFSSFDTLVLFSGDSDFVALLERVRRERKRSIIISRKGHVAKELFPMTDQYFDVIDLRSVFLRVMPCKKPRIPREAGSGG